MGQVFLGETPGRRKVAVKLIRSEYADDPDFRLRFAREVAAARQVGGFHTALVIDADPDDDPPWMATVYIAGPSLSAAVAERGPFEPDAIRDLGAALAEGLSAIHNCGLVHRDFKPSNIILGEDGPRIIDFGIAKSVTATTITPEGVHIGTLQYMSPEHLGAGEITAASDVFSLGSVLAFAATGDGPFDAADDVAIMGRILAQAPSLGSLEAPLRDVISACLDKDPAGRPTLEALLAFFAGAEGALFPPPIVVRGSDTSTDSLSQPQWNQPVTATLEPAIELAAGPVVARAIDIPVGQKFPPGDKAASGVGGGNRSRMSIADLPPDVRLRFWRNRGILMVVVGMVAAALTRSWEIACMFAILAGVADAIYRSRNVASYTAAGSNSKAIKRTRRQLALMRRMGYLGLDEWRLPDGGEVIDQLVIGPTGVYAIDSERWDPNLPIRALNGRIFHGLESKNDRVDRLGLQAQRVSEILSEALGAEIIVRAVLAVYGVVVPWTVVSAGSADVIRGSELRTYFRRRARTVATPLTSQQVQVIYDTAARVLPPAGHDQPRA